MVLCVSRILRVYTLQSLLWCVLRARTRVCVRCECGVVCSVRPVVPSQKNKKTNDKSECLLTAYYSTTGVNEGFSSEPITRLICYGFAWDYLQDAAPVELYSVCTWIRMDSDVYSNVRFFVIFLRL